MSRTPSGGVPVVSERIDDVKRESLVIAVTGLAEGIDHYQDTDERFVELVGRLALADDGWLVRFIGWLRGHDALASAAVVAAAELVRARLGAGLTTAGGNRKVISGVLRRADEPGALLAYWFRRYGRALPKPIRHGLADAVRRLYDERALLAYDGVSAAVRFADVIGRVHPKPATREQDELFRYAKSRHDRPDVIPESLPTIRRHAWLYGLTIEERRAVLDEARLADVLADAGMTWDLLDGWLLGENAPRAWEAVLPSMGYADRLDRLPALDRCGITPEWIRRIGDELADPERIVRERIGPLRLYAAGREASSRRWGRALERALDASLADVPALPGRTLILIDRSASMFTQIARGSAVTVADQATVFGVALALRADSADLLQFGTSHRPVAHRATDSLLAVVERFGEMGDGNAAEAVRAHYAGHDRVVIVTDEPTGSAWRGEDPAALVPASVPSYAWNVASIAHDRAAAVTEPRRHLFSGLDDGAFAAIPLIEAAYRSAWPF